MRSNELTCAQNIRSCSVSEYAIYLYLSIWPIYLCWLFKQEFLYLMPLKVASKKQGRNVFFKFEVGLDEIVLKLIDNVKIGRCKWKDS